ncbi:MAG: site-specific DNA-methyltransferase [Paludibacteraceae bacterium]|nr:site-specific DNA-methyltransferase [Paludibacteraceae bacterium]
MPTLNWIGKDKVINHHLDVPFHTLDKQYTVGDSDSGNKIINGDNLVALKALLPEYEGKIKCIYIDPPYNTGNEGWIYNDNVNAPQIKRWLGQVVGKEGEDLSRHDKWLCMMYPRLQLLHKLLADDGAIFISIDDNEQANLKLLCDEIFGEGNFVGSITWESTTQPANSGSAKYNLQQKSEFILLYKKGLHKFLIEEYSKEGQYPHNGNFGKCRFEIIEKSDAGGSKRDTMKFQILGQYPRSGKRWQIGEETARQLEKEGKVEIVDGIVKKAIYPEDEIDKQNYVPFWSHFSSNFGTAQSGKETLNKIMSKAVGFDTVKPPLLLENLLSHFDKSSIILDSFAGSGTTAHAVLNLNKKDGGNRKFILVEMEDYAETITAERVKRVINGYGEGDKAVEGTGGGFDYFSLGKTIFNADGNLNEDVGVEKIREYIWYSETGTSLPSHSNDYFLGSYNATDYYFYYEQNEETILTRENIGTIIKQKAEGYIIYADACQIEKKFMETNNITFKRIPRDIKKL